MRQLLEEKDAWTSSFEAITGTYYLSEQTVSGDVPENCGKSFSKIRKPVKQDGAYHLQMFSADERLESGKFNKG